jgi:hypothetical protein
VQVLASNRLCAGKARIHTGMYIQAILTTRTIQPHSYDRPLQKRCFLASDNHNNGYVTRGQLLQQSKAPTKKKSPPSEKKKKQRLSSLLVYIELLMRSITRQKTLPTWVVSPIIQLTGNPLCHHHNPSTEPCTP